MSQKPSRPLKSVRRRGRAENPTPRYDEGARRRVTRLASRHGGPALEVGAGRCACMALRLAHSGMRVTAVDRDAKAVSIAKRAAAVPEVKGRLKVQRADARRLPFVDGSYRVVLAFDCLGHARAPKRILAEMFRVCSRDGVVLITEYNERGRRATQHRNFGFEDRLAELLQAHCSRWRRIDQPHHVTYVCDATGPPQTHKSRSGAAGANRPGRRDSPNRHH